MSSFIWSFPSFLWSLFFFLREIFKVFFVFVYLGSRVERDCTNTNSTKCKPCPSGQYIDTINYVRKCEGCKTCKSNVALFFCLNQPLLHDVPSALKTWWLACYSLFFSFFVSPDLEDLVSKCERHKDTICRCKKGYYKFNIDSAAYNCLKCQSCDQNEIEKQKCEY